MERKLNSYYIMMGMDIQKNVSLANYSTMGLGGLAAHLVDVTTRNEIVEALDWAKANKLPAVMIGGGSNIIWNDSGYSGLVMVNKIAGCEIQQEDDTSVYLKLGSGEQWDGVVGRSVAAGLTGIEALSLIPGTVGATPIQNVGAYGQEISQTLMAIEAFDAKVGGFITVPASDCGFGYRTSRFKTVDRDRFFITSITLRLAKGKPLPPFYAPVQAYFDEHSITDYTPAALRKAVIAIRTSKLPDPAVVNNTGSFFANPLVSDEQLVYLNSSFERIPHWPLDKGGAKLSAAWLIDQAGFRDYHDTATGMATWPKQSLVLINEHAKTTADLLAFKQKIVDAVESKFNIKLQQEPELLPHA